MPEFTIGDHVTYAPSFGLPKPVIVMSSTDGSGYIDIQFVNLTDFEEFCDMGISLVISEIERIGRVSESALSFLAPEHFAEIVAPANVTAAPPNTLDFPRNDLVGGRRRPSSRDRRRRIPRRRLGHRH